MNAHCGRGSSFKSNRGRGARSAWENNTAGQFSNNGRQKNAQLRAEVTQKLGRGRAWSNQSVPGLTNDGHFADTSNFSTFCHTLPLADIPGLANKTVSPPFPPFLWDFPSMEQSPPLHLFHLFLGKPVGAMWSFSLSLFNGNWTYLQ